MLIPVERLKHEFGVNPMGILHLGADVGQEAKDYDRYWRCPTWWIEARHEAATKCKRNVARYRNQHVIEAAVSEFAHERVTLHVANNGQSSSLLPLGTHEQHHPEVSYVGEQTVVTTTVDDLVSEHGVQADFVNLDLQQIELSVLRGAQRFLEGCRWVYSEVSTEAVYKGGCLIGEMDEWLGPQGFARVATEMTPFGWGDGMWSR